MSKQKRATVVILNPRDGRKYTSLKSAEDYVRRGAAVLQSEGLRFIDETPRSACIRAAVVSSAEATYDRASGSGLASVESLEGLPAIGDVVKMLVKPGGGRKAARFICKPAVILFQEVAA